MTQKELAQRLATTGLPVAYQAFRTRQAPPFVCYLFAYDSQFYADDGMYFSAGRYQVEIYTSTKDPVIEARVEAVLAGLCWEKSEEYIDEEKIYQITYEIEV